MHLRFPFDQGKDAFAIEALRFRRRLAKGIHDGWQYVERYYGYIDHASTFESIRPANHPRGTDATFVDALLKVTQVAVVRIHGGSSAIVGQEEQEGIVPDAFVL